MVVAVGMTAVDYGRMSSARSDLQSLADTAALAAARELRLANSSEQAVLQVAENQIRAQLDPTRQVQFSGLVENNNTLITVKLDETIETYLAATIGFASGDVSVTSKAKVLGGTPSCMIGLDDASPGTIDINVAKVTAPACAVYANSTASKSLDVKSGGSVTASFICSSGGYSQNGGWMTPTPQTDCPVAPDPLADRPQPTVGACDYDKMKVDGVTILNPGVYCGGIEIKSGAVVTMLPGTYIIKDGRLVAQKNANVTGANVGFFLTGNKAGFDFDKTSVISLTAPIAGDMAGMLFFEDRSNAVGGISRMNSHYAPVLLGTFYLSRSALEVGDPLGASLTQAVVGALSAWTIVVANKVQINDGINLTLNTNYAASQIPVPNGVGNMSSKIQLWR